MSSQRSKFPSTQNNNKPVGSIKGSNAAPSKQGSQQASSAKGQNKMAQSQQLALPKQQLDELSQAVELTTTKFEKLMRSTDELVQRSVQNPGEQAKAQDSINLQIEEQGFNMIQTVFNRLGGQKAVQSFMEKRFPNMYREPEPSMREHSDEGSSVHNSMRQSSVIGGKSQSPSHRAAVGGGALEVKSLVTNTKRSTLAQNGMIQPFDQVMSNFAMYGLANRHSLSGPVDTSPSSQVSMMQELTGLCLKIYRSVNLRFQRIAQMMLSGNTQELKDLIETNFHYKMISYQSLVLTRISNDCLMVDEPAKRIGIIDERALVKQHELQNPDGNPLRSTLRSGSYIFSGYSNGVLQRLDSETLEADMVVSLHTHIFCIEQFDEDHIICGQLNGWIDLVRIADGQVVLSKELKHVTGNITMIQRTGRGNEVMLGTQRGIYFALIGRGLGLMEVEMERFDKTQTKFGKHLILDEEQQSLRIPEVTERAEMTTAGAKHTDLDGMSQLTFHSQSQFGKQDQEQIDDDASGRQSQTQSVYTKPFTVQSQKGSEKSKMQPSMQSKPGTEVARTSKHGNMFKKKDRQPSNIPEKVSEQTSQEAMGEIAQTVRNSQNQGSKDRSKSSSRNKGNIQSQQLKAGSILKNSTAMKASQQQPMTNQLSKSKQITESKRSNEVAESQDMVMQSQNSNALSQRLKQVRHADQVNTSKDKDGKSMRSGDAADAQSANRSNMPGVGRDSEDPTEDVDGEGKMDVQDRSNSRGSKQDEGSEDEEVRFVLSAERYLIGHDIRGIVHLEGERFGIVAWNDNKVYSVDREKPDAVIQFNMPHGERNSISMRLIPFYDANQFPFAVVLCQTSICCIDFKRYNSFKICPWRYKGVPNNVNQLEMHLSKEDDQVGEQINIVTLEFDGSNSFVRRLVLDHDCIQALNFLG